MLPWMHTKKKITVIGDLILDEYIDGAVKRISPEAPVPIHQVQDYRYTAGGAANTARNIKKLGGHVTLVGVIGCDIAGEKIKSQLTRNGINPSTIIEDPNWSTIKKTRVTSNSQQLLRIDWEKKTQLQPTYYSKIMTHLQQNPCDIMVISDYAKGLLSKTLLEHILHFSRKQDIYTIVDPKQKDFTCYTGCDLITPNLNEAKTALSLEDDQHELNAEDIGRRLQQHYQLNNVLLTLGDKGMIYLSANSKATTYKKSQAQEVFDVSGAGDTVVAIMALATTEKTPLSLTLDLANLAASLVIKKWGTQALTYSELEEALNKQKHHSPSTTKIKSQKELIHLVKKLKDQNKKIVFTNGCFDILHAGHVDYLEKASQLGDVLIIGINTDDSVTQLKGPQRPINKLFNRQKILASLQCVHYLVAFDDKTPKSLIQGILPHVLVKGGDYQIEHIVGQEEVQQHGGLVTTIPLTPGLSTSSLIQQAQSVQDPQA